MAEYTDIQKFMIAQITKAIEEENEKLNKAPYEEKFKHRQRLAQLNKQLENAKKPVVRTEKEKELIDKMIKSTEKNIEMEEGKEIEGRGKELTSKEELEYKFSQYDQSIENQTKTLNNNLQMIKAVGALLEDILTKPGISVVQKDALLQDLKAKKEIQNQLLLSQHIFKDRLQVSKEVQEWALNNYEMLSKLNQYLGNPLQLKDYEEYTQNLKKEYEVK